MGLEGGDLMRRCFTCGIPFVTLIGPAPHSICIECLIKYGGEKD